MTDHKVTPWIRWRNFRGFEDTGRVELKPLTVLLGANSSGKSSVYKPLLLLQQTIGSRRERPGLITRGETVNAGGFSDLVPLGNDEATIRLEIGFHTHDKPRDVGPVGSYPPGVVDLTFGCRPDSEDVQLRTFQVRDIYERRLLQRSLLDSGRFSLNLNTPSRSQKIANPFDALVRKYLRGLQPSHFLFSGSQAFSRAITEVDKDGKESFSGEGLELSEYVSDCLRALDTSDGALRYFLRTLNYVGPLREPPRRSYEVSGEAPTSVGLSGEFAPEVFFRGRQDALGADTCEVLRDFGFVDDLIADDIASGLFMLGVARDGWERPINIADLGFGVSQILPIVVQGLMLGEDDFLLAEQPEIHLNPALQAKLGDFFASLISKGRNVLVETHSEHLLLRLRRCVAEGILDADDVAIYFVEMLDGVSTIRPIPIDQLGHIDNAEWPRGFFEDALAEALALSAAQSKAAKRAS